MLLWVPFLWRTTLNVLSLTTGCYSCEWSPRVVVCCKHFTSDISTFPWKWDTTSAGNVVMLTSFTSTFNHKTFWTLSWETGRIERFWVERLSRYLFRVLRQHAFLLKYQSPLRSVNGYQEELTKCKGGVTCYGQTFHGGGAGLEMTLRTCIKLLFTLCFV